MRRKELVANIAMRRKELEDKLRQGLQAQTGDGGQEKRREARCARLQMQSTCLGSAAVREREYYREVLAKLGHLGTNKRFIIKLVQTPWFWPRYGACLRIWQLCFMYTGCWFQDKDTYHGCFRATIDELDSSLIISLSACKIHCRTA